MRRRLFLVLALVLLGACGNSTVDQQIFSQRGSVQVYSSGAEGQEGTNSWSVGYPSWTVQVSCEGVGGTFPVTVVVVAEPSGPDIKTDTVQCPQDTQKMYSYDLQGTGTYSVDFKESAGTVDWTVVVISHH